MQDIQIETKSTVESLLTQICKEGDSLEYHHQIDYDTFMQIQLEILRTIIETEKSITKRKKQSSSLESLQMVDCLKERRHLLKLLGSAVAWILLEFNRPYIRTLAMGPDSGFISGKEGLRAEVYALKKFHDPKNGRTALLHDITHCLRVGDLTVIGPAEAYPLEIKLTKKRKKLGRRKIRQKRRMKILQEYYYKGESDKIHPGWTALRQIRGEPDKHNCEKMIDGSKKPRKRDNVVSSLRDACSTLPGVMKID